MLIFDCHCDSLSCALTAQYSLNEKARGRQFDFASAVGVSHFQVAAIFVDKEPREQINFADFMVLRNRLIEAVAGNERVELITGQQALLGLPEEKLGVIMAVEGAEVIGRDLARLQQMYDLGVRTLTLAWNNDNALASGGQSGHPDQGLTVLGKEAVSMMNALGMLVDIAHLAPRGVKEVMMLTDAPIIASHANCAALCKHPRNLTDDTIRQLARLGGVIGVTYVPEFLCENYLDATVDDLIDQIAHVAYLVGAEYVGLGSDFDGITHLLPGLEQVSCVPALAEKLHTKGFHQEEIEKIMGKNFMRVFGEVLK